MSGWRVAKSLLVLLKQVNHDFPDRNKDWDGTIGDQAHAQRNSDHNPLNGVVHALDITNDPKHRLSSEQLAETIRKSNDRRVQYVISNGKIANMDIDHGMWRPYGGKNPHDHHCHISVRHGAVADDESPWAISPVNVAPTPQEMINHVPPPPLLQFGSKGVNVEDLQKRLNKLGEKLDADGYFFGKTRDAVRRFQEAQGISVDGKVGPQTWKLLKEKTDETRGS